MFSNLYQSTQDWFLAPFKQPMDVVQVFLAVGLVIIAVIFWSRIIAHISEG